MADRVDGMLETLVQSLVERIEQGAGSWSMPWRQLGLPHNVTTGVAYQGVNVLQLWLQPVDRQLWATYKQFQHAGGQVRKGERGVQLVKWSPVQDRRDENRTRLVPYVFTVFNVAQQDGFEPEPVPVLPESERVGRLDDLLGSVPAAHEVSERAAYSALRDVVYMPPFDRFESASAFYGTWAHELCHWTGHRSRLNRDLSGRFGDDSYAMEELVAELGAALWCAQHNVDSSSRSDDHAAYLASWCRVLKADPRVLFSVMKQAHAAVQWLGSYQEVPSEVAV